MRLWLFVLCGAALAGDPVHRIVQLLNDLSQQVQREGEEEKGLFEKFMCWCENGKGEEIEALNQQKFRIERLHPSIEQAAQQVALLEEQITESDTDLAAHQQAKAGADALRAGEEEKYKADTEVLKQTLQGLDKALAVLRHASDVAAFVQASVSVKQALTPFSQTQRVRTVLDDRQVQAMLTASPDTFLQVRTAVGLGSPDHIIGVLDGLREGFAHDLSDAESSEQAARVAYNGLISSKGKELVAAKGTLRQLTEEKTGLNAQLARDRDDIAATQVSFAQDTAAFEARKAECETKTQEFHARQQSRLEEMLAINEATQVLSADDVHVVFSKSVTAQALPSFLQLAATVQKASGPGDPHDVMTYVRELAKANPQKPMLAQLALKLEGMSGQSFERVLQVIRQQIQIMDMEQAQEDQKKGWCELEIAKNKDSIQLKQNEEKDFEAQIGNAEGDLVLLRDEAASIAKEIDEINRQLDDAARQREAERSSFDTTIAEVKQAQTALVKAIQVLEGFYGQQSLLQQRAQLQAQMQQQTAVNELVNGQYESRSVSQNAPPTATGEYQGAEGGRSILSLLGQIGEDLVKEEESRRTEEKEAKQALAELQAQTQVNTKLKTEQLMSRREQIARLEQGRDEFQNDMDAARTLINELKSRELDLAKNCYILQDYDRRKSLRAGERDSMEKAIQILS